MLLKSPAFNNISVTKSVLVLFPTFSNANRLEKAWISKKVLGNTYVVKDHVQKEKNIDLLILSLRIVTSLEEIVI